VQYSNDLGEAYGFELITVEIKKHSFCIKHREECDGVRIYRNYQKILQKMLRTYNRHFKKIRSFDQNDILVLIQHHKGIEHMPAIKAFKVQGGKVVYVMHDLIPIRYPAFCEKESVENYTRWFHETLKVADAYITVSKTVLADIHDYFDEHGLDRGQYAFDHFRLGSDHHAQEEEPLSVRNDVRRVFAGHASVYLTVSTIEPRKNHSYLLKAFEILWEREIDAVLLIVGKVGWKVDTLIAQIKTHAQYGKKLIMFNDMDDQALRYCYAHAKVFLFPSYTEGFGIPIVESLQVGLPVLASDTPIHREVGEKDIDYFDVSDPDTLVERIKAIEKGKIALKDLGKHPVRMTSWRESTEALLSKIRKYNDRASMT